jgi:hypothetical protein
LSGSAKQFSSDRQKCLSAARFCYLLQLNRSAERKTALAAWGVVNLNRGGNVVSGGINGLALLRLLLHRLL